MNNIMMISEELLKTYTAINDNVQTDELRYCILTSQNIQIQETLGTNLYNKMLDLIRTGDISLTVNSNYKTLLDNYIQPALINYSYYMALDNFMVKFMSVGLVQNRSEQGNSIDFKTFQFLKSNAKDQAEFSDNLLRRHLIFRSGLYPEYNNGNLNDGQLPPETKTAFASSITLPGTGYYWRKKIGSNNFNALGALCCGSQFPTWYGHSNNS